MRATWRSGPRQVPPGARMRCCVSNQLPAGAQAPSCWSQDQRRWIHLSCRPGPLGPSVEPALIALPRRFQCSQGYSFTLTPASVSSFPSSQAQALSLNTAMAFKLDSLLLFYSNLHLEARSFLSSAIQTLPASQLKLLVQASAQTPRPGISPRCHGRPTPWLLSRAPRYSAPRRAAFTTHSPGLTFTH